MEKDLKWIKKHYGEEMMRLCRELFPKILETEGLLPDLLKEHFPNNHYLALDIKKQNGEEQFKNYIYSLIDVENGMRVQTQNSAVELMEHAGYILYPECKTEQDVQSFRKWWESDEELCTFNGNRLNSCRVWFAVKKNANEIKRDDFKEPTRQDEYGTSVISIQFTRGEEQYLSIKNRYNHSVNNPDNTFNSNLDNIVPGLTDAFERDYGVRERCDRPKTSLELEHYVCVDGKFYYYNYEINNIYYCDDGIIIDNFEVKKLPEHQMLIDYFIVDFNKKTVFLYDKKIHDSFCESLGKIKRISFANGVLNIFADNENEISIGVSPRNEVTLYKNSRLKKVGNNFMCRSVSLEKLYLPNLQSMGEYCFAENQKMTELRLSKLQSMGAGCFFCNKNIKELNVPSLRSMGDCCFYHNEEMEKLNAPDLRGMGKRCFYSNEGMIELSAQNLQSMDSYCFVYNQQLVKLDMPKLLRMGDKCFYSNEQITELKLSNLQNMGDKCFLYNKQLTDLNVPKLQEMGDKCFHSNKKIIGINASKLRRMGEACFYGNEEMTELNLPELQDMGGSCFYKNDKITEFNLPKLKVIGIGCFAKNDYFEDFYLQQELEIE